MAIVVDITVAASVAVDTEVEVIDYRIKSIPIIEALILAI